MAVKSIIDIEVNSRDFERFQALFDKYQEQLAKTPSIWSKASKENATMAKHFQAMAAALMANQRIGQEIDRRQKDQAKNLTDADRKWASIAKSSKSVAGDLISATRSLISWSGILGGIGGLLGIGGLFGLDRMAGNVAGQRRSAMGLGVSIGQQKSFQIHMSRLVDPDAFLSSVNEIEHDPSKMRAMGSLGLGPPTGDVMADGMRILDAMRQQVKAYPSGMRAMLPKMFGVEGVDLPGLNRMDAMGEAEYGKLKSDTWRDAKAFDIPDKDAERWTNFVNKLEGAGQKLLRVIEHSLLPMEGPLEHLSDAFTKLVDVVMRKDGLVEQGINKVASWIDDFAGEISKPDFLDNVKKFTSSIGDMAEVMHKIAHPLDAIGQAWNDTGEAFNEWLLPSKQAINTDKDTYETYLSRLNSHWNLPEGTMQRMWYQGSGDSLVTTHASLAGGRGPFNITPDMARRFNVNPLDPQASAAFVAQAIGQTAQAPGQTMDSAIAAYLAKSGTQQSSDMLTDQLRGWQGGLSSDLQQRGPTYPGTAVMIRVENATGGSAVISSSQLPQ